MYEKKVVASHATGRTRGENKGTLVGKEMASPVPIQEEIGDVFLWTKMSLEPLCPLFTNPVKVFFPITNLLCQVCSQIHLAFYLELEWLRYLQLKCKLVLDVSLQFTLLGRSDTVLENTVIFL